VKVCGQNTQTIYYLPDRCAELLSKEINHTITPAEAKDIITFQNTHPKTCPKCQATVFSYFTPDRVVSFVAADVSPLIIFPKQVRTD
jgi:hypothetical protein